MTNLSPPAGASLPQPRHQSPDSDSGFDSYPLSEPVPVHDDRISSDSDSDPALGSGAHILSPHHSNPRSHSNSHHRRAQSHSHLHSHSHDSRRLRHTHQHPDRAPVHGDNSDNSDNGGNDSESDELLDRRQPAPDDNGSAAAAAVDDLVDDVTDPLQPSFVRQVVQTVSLIQVVDGSGAPLETRTLYAPPATVLFDPASGDTVAISSQDSQATSAARSVDPAASDASAESRADGALPTKSMTLSSRSLSLPQSLSNFSGSLATPLPTAPSSNVSAIPSLGGPQNANNTLSGANSSLATSSSANSSRMKMLDISTTPTSLSFTTSSDSSTTSLSTSFSDSVLSSISSDLPTSTVTSASGGSHGGGHQPSSTAAVESTGGGGPDLSPQQKKIVGGVVGSIAGVAFILLALLLALKHKKRRDERAKLAEGLSGAASRGVTGGGSGGPPEGDSGGDSRGDMAERSAPFGLTSALAGLAKKRGAPAQIEGATPEGGERGFYRVSGRKLPSVLQAGGDGYTDPRESMVSGTSDYYRGSRAFEPVSGGSTRLQLGSPMRPVSGVAVMRSGPARTPVTENPFEDPFEDPPSSPPPVLDPLGRTMPGQDGSRGSGSRFQEEI